MRELVLVIAVVLCAGSAKNAQQRHGLRTWACDASTTTTLAQKQSCINTANTQYAVESQREIVDEQNAWVDQQQQAARCERVAGILMRCQITTPERFTTTHGYCVAALNGTAPQGYGATICVEQAADCDGVKWCIQPH